MRNYRLEKPRYFINSLAKGLSLLQAFAEAGRALTLSEIANAMEVNHTTATRLCYTLTELGFIQRDDHRRYLPTPKLLTLGYAFILCSGQGMGFRSVHRKTEIHTKGEVEMDNWLKGKTAIIIGERDGVQGPSIAKCLEAAGANVVYAVTECFV